MENRYLVFLKDEDYLAIRNNLYGYYDRNGLWVNTSSDLNKDVLCDTLYEQKYFFIKEFYGFQVSDAIDQARKHMKNEINRLNQEIRKLKLERDKAILEESYDESIEQIIIDKIDAYEVLGANKDSSKDEIEKKYKKIRSKLHPDNGVDGSSFLFRLVKDAFDKIKKDKGF